MKDSDQRVPAAAETPQEPSTPTEIPGPPVQEFRTVTEAPDTAAITHDVDECDPNSFMDLAADEQEELREFLDKSRSDTVIEDAPFKKCGRHYHEPHLESAMIGLLINRPDFVPWAAEKLMPGDFFLENFQHIFTAILNAHNKGATGEGVLTYLKQTGYDTAELYADMEAAARSGFNHKYKDFIASRLKKAARIRGGETYCCNTYSEYFCAELMVARLPDMRCVGNKWLVYKQGVWVETNVADFQPTALAVIHPAHRDSQRAKGVLDQVRMMRQWPENTLHSACKFDDSNNVLINVHDVVLRVRTDGLIEKLEHSPDFRFMGKLACEWNPEAECGLFHQKLEEMLPDPEDRELLQVFCGYILYPSCKYETALVAYGAGGTGKSTVATVISDVLGPGLMSSAGLEELCKSGSYVLPTLKGKLLNLGSELSGTATVESANFKKLVSGEAMSVRQIYQSPEDMRTTAKLMFLSNNQPRFHGGTDAEVRRLRILPFNQKPAVVDVDLKTKLAAELSGVLNWMLEGLVKLMTTGKIPMGGQGASLAMDTFKKFNDPVGAFLEKCCLFDGKQSTLKTALFEEFKEWCDDQGISSEKMESYFWKTLYQRHPEVKSSRQTIDGARVYVITGLGLQGAARRQQDSSANDARGLGGDGPVLAEKYKDSSAAQALIKRLKGTKSIN